jgi:hypothetical protein
MTNDEKYLKIFETLTEKVAEGTLTEEKASEINDLAWDKYMTVTESKKDDVLALLDQVRAGVEDGSLTLDDDLIDELKEAVGGDKGDDDKDTDDKGDDDASKEEEAKEAVDDILNDIDAYLESLTEE